MASRQLFDPLTLLRVSPLVTATCSLWFSWDQHFFLHLFNKPEHRATSNHVLPSYFRLFFRGAVVRVLALLSLTTSTSLYNHFYLDRPSSRAWYAAGAAFAGAHLLFVPWIAPRVVAVAEGSPDGRSTDDLGRWLSLHVVRTLTVDLAAWASLIVAVTRDA